ncbi:MAG: phosphatase PAP2 family protein [Bacteroidetes bacterium]|nr:phosphatase PAP2 family protein [Bacteroidota bacterium]HET6244927.1 phosphatase PAP2 family protein [Bacteroidia bacterium]
MKQRFFFSIILLIFSVNAHSQISVDNSPRLSKQYFKSGFSDIKDIALAPLYMDKTQWITFWAIAGTGYFVYTQDLRVQQFSQLQRTPTSNGISQHVLEPLGSGLYSSTLIGLLYLHGTLAKNDRTKRVALISAKTLVISGPIILLSKAAFYRDRPYYSENPDPGNWHGFATGLKGSTNFKDFNYSTAFPSGHTTSAFAIATIVAMEYKDKPIIPIIAYSLATLTGLSRIHDNKHWGSDVFGGAVLGYALARVIYSRNNAEFSISPYKTKNETGFHLVLPIKAGS